MATQVDVVIMAAGKGTRMKSLRPKVLHRLAGKPLVNHVIDCATRLQARRAVVITGHQAEQVEAALAPLAAGALPLQFVRQMPQLGTGHAVQQAVPVLDDDGVTLVLSGDVPLTQADTLHALLQACDGQHLALLTLDLPDPTGYGRIVRGPGEVVQAIVEHKDASEEQRRIAEIYSGIMAVPTRLLRGWLARLDNQNAQGEYYLTDIVKFAVADGLPVLAHRIHDALQVAGINSPAQLAELERAHQRRVAEALLEQGVRLADPARLDVRGALTCGQDVEIDINCVFEGAVSLGDGVEIGPYCVLKNVTVAAGTRLAAFCHCEDAVIGEQAVIGPYARLRPGAELAAEVHVGNFVEIKKSRLGRQSKANHLAYIGDAEIGERVNVGAGTITCNYDGVNKHKTIVEDDVFIGSDTQLVAPVTVGRGATLGAGTTLTKNAPPNALTVSRPRQLTLEGWQRPQKKSSDTP